MNIVIIGLSLSSSWGNGHATTYRSLVKGLHAEGHEVTFLEQNVSWYAENRDLTSTPYCRLIFYENLELLKSRYKELVEEADVVIVGSYVRHGIEIGEWVLRQAKGITAFYDIDTPVTLAKLEKKECKYLSARLIPRYNLYFSFSGGSAITLLTEKYAARMAKPLFCSVDPDLYYPEKQQLKWQLGYLGTYSDDRQPGLKKLLLNTATKLSGDSFVVAGPQYPAEIEWPANVERINHLPPGRHREFYNQQRFTLNLTRTAMVKIGLSPSVRLFEAAACGTPIISDYWEGLDTLFEPGEEILVAESTEDVLKFLTEIPEQQRKRIGEQARKRVLKEHSSTKRARQLLHYVQELKEITV